MDNVPKLELTPEEALALNTGIKVMMGTIMKTNKFILGLTNLTKEQAEEVAELLDIYTSLYNEYLDGEAKEKVIWALTKGQTKN